MCYTRTDLRADFPSSVHYQFGSMLEQSVEYTVPADPSVKVSRRSSVHTKVMTPREGGLTVTLHSEHSIQLDGRLFEIPRFL